jgi:hypothetical protein
VITAGDRKFLWNVGQYLPGYRTQHPRKQPSSCASPWGPEILHNVILYHIRAILNLLFLWWKLFELLSIFRMKQFYILQQPTSVHIIQSTLSWWASTFLLWYWRCDFRFNIIFSAISL